MTRIKEIVVKNWQHFVEFTSEIDVGPPLMVSYFFRGQARTDWKLIPSLVRYAISAGLDSAQALEVEQTALMEFQAQGHLYLPNQMIYNRSDVLSWWGIMQHYNTPTRILDWTISPFVAAYFAVEQELDHPGAVWFVHGHSVEDHMKATYLDYEYPTTIEKMVQVFLDPGAKPVLYLVKPGTVTDRMGAQQTASTISAQILADHGQIIEDILPGQQTKVVFGKVIIPKDLKPEFLHQLRKMNITARALFPGVDGMGRSVAELIKIGAYYGRAKMEEK